MRNLLLVIFFVVAIGGRAQANEAQQSFVTLTSGPANYAWWLRAEFHPFETEVRGIPIRAIRRTWCRASEFRRDLFPQDLQKDLQLASFAVDGFFDDSKTEETALVGAYESCSGVKGSFFLILGWPRQGPPTIRFISEVPTHRQFAILRAEPDSSILIWACMDCDDGSRLKWDRSKRRFISLPLESGD